VKVSTPQGLADGIGKGLWQKEQHVQCWRETESGARWMECGWSVNGVGIWQDKTSYCEVYKVGAHRALKMTHLCVYECHPSGRWLGAFNSPSPSC
jgi:hypothetical protein